MEDIFTHPLKINWGLAAPEVRFLISESPNRASAILASQQQRCSIPSANPKLSATGSKADTVKKEVPSFISSDTILPLRFATTPYTFPRTSAANMRFVKPLNCVRSIGAGGTHSQLGCRTNTWPTSTSATSRAAHSYMRPVRRS